MSNRISCLDHGYIELIDAMGGDIDIVNGARQSFDAVSRYHYDHCNKIAHINDGECNCDVLDEDLTLVPTGLLKQDAGLVNFLMREKHTSPFELVTAKFAVQLPIFVAREWMRHRTQSFNEMSARYTQLPRLFYVPEEIREQRGKPGAYYYERMDDATNAIAAQFAIRKSCAAAFDAYENMLANGVAKEQARGVLPVNTYTKMVVSANLLNWMRFLSLRNHEHAQHEIRVYAVAIEELLQQVAPVAMEKFVEHGRLR